MGMALEEYLRSVDTEWGNQLGLGALAKHWRDRRRIYELTLARAGGSMSSTPTPLPRSAPESVRSCTRNVALRSSPWVSCTEKTAQRRPWCPPGSVSRSWKMGACRWGSGSIASTGAGIAGRTGCAAGMMVWRARRCPRTTALPSTSITRPWRPCPGASASRSGEPLLESMDSLGEMRGFPAAA
ncbi:hypothetical protein ADIAG_00683 [Paeniglutamicibacter gangotriensis Lz1y]|uniref:Uncharacterized protein n=1 Tax=Paeniglutamicibacter gangotriensis Lz1y TaxID=1276920 RepID=M7NM16_9MICC|nr:hypothetical protein ADIAG_00683 [Paeniglutamicibacter gangotriensis Lz1y]